MMVHIDEPPPTIEDVLARLRPGDVLTHAFRPFPNTPVTADGTVKPEILAARERGVLFDIGHGMGSLSFANARAMLANGFLPDCISSDVHALCENGPVFDLLTTLSKFLCLGMPLDAVIGAATVNPARALRRAELGSLVAGNPGDASILDLREGRFSYVDSVGETLTGDRRLLAAGVVIGGRWWHPN
jgi:dihydroorotase